MEGLFVRKHAQAVAKHHRVDVLFLKAEKGIKRWQFVHSQDGDLHEHILYYPKATHKLGKMLALFRAFHKGMRHILRSTGKPDLVHVHVLTLMGALAHWFSITRRVPYVITEHWTRYLRTPFRNKLHQLLTAHVVKHARCVMPVSHNLQEAMQRYGLQGNYKVVLNVVDDFFFQDIREPGSEPIKTILHVCCFSEAAKNNFGLLRTIKKLSEIRSDFRLVMAGDGADFAATKAYAQSLSLSETQVTFIGKLQPIGVQKALAECSFMVLFSNYENLPVVICESLASGKPVVASKVGGIHEMVDESNGILVQAGNEEALLQALNRMLNEYQNFSPKEISHAAQRFSFAEVGKQLSEIYEKVLAKS